MATEVLVSPVTSADEVIVSALHARVFGPGRFVRTAYRVREGTPFASRFCRKAMLGAELLAAIRFTPITVGGKPGALLLGPLAVEPRVAGQGHGKRLVAEAMEAARQSGIALVVLVGNEPYYGRFGFKPVRPGQILLPGPVDLARLLAAELTPGAQEHYRGLIAAE